MSLTTRTIVGQIVYGDGTGGSGTLRFTPEALIAAEGKVLLPGPVIVIAGNGGTFEVDLVVTDAEGYNPENWVWRVEESFPGGRTFLFELPSGEEPIPYTQLIPTAPIADPQAAHEHTQYITFDDVGEIVAGVNTVNGLSGDVTLTASDVGAYPDDNPSGFVDASGASDAAPVQSVNGEVGAVTLGAGDVGAYPDTNPSGFIDASGAPVQSVNSQTGNVTLGAADVGAYPDDNPDGFVNSSEAAAAAPVQSVNSQTGDVSLSASDVGAYPDDNPNAYVDAQGAAAAAPVDSVNGQTGEVVLDASDVGAYPDENPDGFVDAAGAAAAAPVQSVNGETGTVSLDASDVGAYPDTNPDGYVDATGAANAAPVQSVNGETGTVSLTASDVGAYPDDNPDGFVDAAGAAAAAPVQSVNGETGTVSLTAADVGAYPDDNPDSFVDATGAAAAAPVQSVNGETGTVSLTASDVGAYPDDNPDGFVDATGAAAASPVQSVNGETGTVDLTASDVGAYPDTNPDGFVDAAGAAAAAPVQSVNGETGTVSLTAEDVGATADTHTTDEDPHPQYTTRDEVEALFAGEWDPSTSYAAGDIVSVSDSVDLQADPFNNHYSLYRALNNFVSQSPEPRVSPEAWELLSGFERSVTAFSYVGVKDPETDPLNDFNVFNQGPGTGLFFFFNGQVIPFAAETGFDAPAIGAVFADPVLWAAGSYTSGILVEYELPDMTLLVFQANTNTSEEPTESEDWTFIDVRPRFVNRLEMPTIEQLSGVNFTGAPADGNLLVFSSSLEGWTQAPLSIGNLNDVDTTGTQDGNFLSFDGNTGEWKPVPAPAGNGQPVTLDGPFTPQTPVPNNFHFTLNGVINRIGQYFENGTVTPLVFTDEATISELAIQVTQNLTAQFGGDPNGVNVWLVLYDSNENDLPETIIAASPKLEVVPGDAESPPPGAFTDFQGLLRHELSVPVTLDANKVYWVGAVITGRGQFPQGPPPAFSEYQCVSIGRTISGQNGINQFQFASQSSLSSRSILFALQQEQFDFDTDPVPSIDPNNVFTHGPAPLVAVLQQLPEFGGE